MPSTVVNRPASGHPVSLDIGRPVMAKANVQSPDIAWNEAIGAAISKAIARIGWSKKEAAAKVGVDDAEFGKWLSGGRRPQFDRLFAVDALRQVLVVELAGIAGEGVEIETVVRVRRTA